MTSSLQVTDNGAKLQTHIGGPASRLWSLLCLGVRQHVVKDGVAAPADNRYLPPVTCQPSRRQRSHWHSFIQCTQSKVRATDDDNKGRQEHSDRRSVTANCRPRPGISPNTLHRITQPATATLSSKHGHNTSVGLLLSADEQPVYCSAYLSRRATECILLVTAVS